MLADEAHKFKSVNTRTHQSIARLGAQRMLLITATPTINKSIDLFGTLSLIWGGLRPQLAAQLDDADDLDIAENRAASHAMRTPEFNDVNLELPSRVKFLNPWTFKKIVASELQLGTATAAAVLPIILSTIQLRRVKGGVVVVGGENIVIGADIPRYRIQTVELGMDVLQAEAYSNIHEATLADVRRAGGEVEIGSAKGSPMGMAVHRRLCFAAFSIGLDGFFRSARVTTAKVAEWSDRPDYGYTVYHKLSRAPRVARLSRRNSLLLLLRGRRYKYRSAEY